MSKYDMLTLEQRQELLRRLDEFDARLDAVSKRLDEAEQRRRTYLPVVLDAEDVDT